MKLGGLKTEYLLLSSFLILFVGLTAGAGEDIIFTYSDGENITGYVEGGQDRDILPASEVELAGELADINGDGQLELPYVDSNGDIRLVDLDGNQSELLAGSDSVSTSTTANKLAVGDWTGNGNPDVLFPNSQDSNRIYVAEYGGSVSSVNPNVNLAADAVSDVVDFTGNGEKDIVFVGTSQELKYYHSAQQTVVSTGINVGKNNNVGLGPTEDFNDNGESRAYIIDGSQQPALVDSSSNKEIVSSTQNAVELPVAAQIRQSETVFYYQEGADIFRTNFTGPAEQLSFTTSTESGYKYGLLSGKIESIPEPIIEEIRIFDVEGLEDKTTGGSLIDQGLNKTFRLNQSDPESYRFEFDVLNNGTGAWSLKDQDLITHRGLNQSWNVTNIGYFGSSQSFTGGSFNSGNVEWDTSAGGSVDTGDLLEAQYVVNISQASTQNFSQAFEVDIDGAGAAGDDHVLETTILGFLNPVIDRPENNSVVQNNRGFILNGTIECLEGECGQVSVEPRRNSSDSQISFTGDRFELLETVESCGTLLKDEKCSIEFNVNATAGPNTFHELDLQASSNYNEVADQSSQNAIVEIRDILVVDLEWDSIDFGLLDPGERDRPAENNSEGYNLTVEEDSNTVDNLWLKGSDLVHTESPEYEIGIGNLTYNNSVNNPENSISVTNQYSLLDTDVTPGTTKTFYYWLDVPLGILRGAYTGSVTFKANQSSQ